MRFFIYSRKSVATGRGDSIGNQVELCRRHIAERLGEGEISLFEDEGYSGKTCDRPEFRRMLAELRREPPDFLVCYRLDRISRSVSDFSALIEELNRRGVAFVCVSEEFDTSRPMGKAMMYIASVFAQLERETIAERVRDNMLLLARTGRWLGGTPPTGFSGGLRETILLDGKRQSVCGLVANEAEQRLVRRIFALASGCVSLTSLGRELEREGFRTRRSGSFSSEALRKILRNPVYCVADESARIYFNETGAVVCFEPDGESGLIGYNKGSRGAPIVAAGLHRGLISGEEFVRVQRRLDLLSHTRARNSGRLKCPLCGGRMLAKPRSDGSGRFDYICETKLKHGKSACPSRNLPGLETDARIEAGLAVETPDSRC